LQQSEDEVQRFEEAMAPQIPVVCHWGQAASGNGLVAHLKEAEEQDQLAEPGLNCYLKLLCL
jgi:hypothetical protein